MLGQAKQTFEVRKDRELGYVHLKDEPTHHL